MAQDGWRPSAIADEVGLGEAAVRDVLYEAGIPTVEALVGKTKRIDVNQVMSSVIEATMPSEPQVVDVLSPMGDEIAPANEAQARE